MLLSRLTRSLKKHKVQYALAGGWAVALHGAVRGTVDIDIAIVLTRDNLSRTEKALQSMGLESRLPVTVEDLIQFREEYIKNKKMLAWRFTNPQDGTEVIDVLIVQDLKELEIEKMKVGNELIPVISKPDLIKMKKRSGRPQDLEDVEALEAIKK